MAAASEIEKLEARYAENPDGRYFAPLADAYRKAGRVDDALQLVRRGLEKHPDYLSAHIVLGRCQLDKKDDLAAVGAFETVLGLDAENIIALKSLAEISERSGDTVAARRWLQKLLVVDSMNTDADADLLRLGGPLHEEGQGETAAPEEAPALDISFADVIDAAEASPEAAPSIAVDTPTEAVPAIALEAPEPAPRTEAPTEPIPAIVLDEPGPPPEVARMPEVTPFDESLQWGGAGERMSGAIRAEDLEQARREPSLVAPAIHFLDTGPADEAAPPESTAPPPEPPAEAPVPADSVRDGAPEVASMDFGAAHRSAAAEATDQPATGSDIETPLDVNAGATTAAVSSPAGDLPLIMPEDVTPPEEMRRPSIKMVQMFSPQDEDSDAAGAGGAPPLLTETMGDLYLQQGLKSQAADVYRQLLARRPDDAALRVKLAQVEGPAPSLSAAALGMEPVGTWLRRVAGASLDAPPAAPTPPPSQEPTPMDAAFAAPEPEPAATGEPAHPASAAFSLDQIFGTDSAGGAPAAPVAPTPPAPAGPSFDEFFGAAPEQASVRPKPAEASPPADDDLNAFNAWLHGLKR